MVPAGLRWLPDGRGGVRYRLDGGFPRRGCVLGRGARTHLTGSSFRAFRFATRYPGGRRGVCFRADVHIRPLHQFPRGTASGSEKRSRDNAITTPTTSAPSATGRQSQKSQKMIACPKAGQNRRLHRSADPRRAEARTRRSASKRSFLLDRARPVSLLARPKGAPAAPRAVGRGGAREQAQFSPQAETELSGLCDDDNGGRIPRGSGPCGSRISRGRRSAAQPVSVESPPQRFPAGPAQAGGGLPRGGNQPLRDAGTRRLGYSALRGASKIFVKNSALDGNFSPLPCVSTGKRSRCSPESIGKDERE